MAEMMKSKKAGLCLVIETKRYLPYVSGLKFVIPVIDAWARSRDGHTAERCVMPRRAKTWHGLGSWILGGVVLTRCYEIAIEQNWRHPGIQVIK
jgi:hypothetical protein